MELTDIRRKLHSLAETAHEEKETASFVSRVLQNTGVNRLHTGLGGYGVIGTIDSGNPGPSLLFRAELDALPIFERNNFEYASLKPGISHKCGHDGHMTILLGLAEKLRNRPLRKGRVHLLFQPAEETGEGALQVLDTPEVSGMKIDHVFALHNLPGYPLHSVWIREGVFAAGSKGLIVRLGGETAHAAHPEKANSPADAMASLIQQWQALPQRLLPLGRASGITVIHARLGERAFGTTPGYAEIMATLRAYEPEDMETLARSAQTLAESEAEKWGLDCILEWTEPFSPVLNHAEPVGWIREAVSLYAKQAENAEAIRVCTCSHPFSWSEDFGRFTERYNGAMFGLGAGENHPALHSSTYDFPDSLLQTGMGLYMSLIHVMGLFNR